MSGIRVSQRCYVSRCRDSTIIIITDGRANDPGNVYSLTFADDASI